MPRAPPLDDMEQRYIQWGNNVVVGHGAVSGGVDWKQEKLKSSGTTSTDVYKRDTTGLYLTGQQQIDSVTLEASGREDHDEQFGWHGTADGRRLGNLSTVIGQSSRTAQDSSPPPSGSSTVQNALASPLTRI